MTRWKICKFNINFDPEILKKQQKSSGPTTHLEPVAWIRKCVVVGVLKLNIKVGSEKGTQTPKNYCVPGVHTSTTGPKEAHKVTISFLQQKASILHSPGTSYMFRAVFRVLN